MPMLLLALNGTVWSIPTAVVHSLFFAVVTLENLKFPCEMILLPIFIGDLCNMIGLGYKKQLCKLFPSSWPQHQQLTCSVFAWSVCLPQKTLESVAPVSCTEAQVPIQALNGDPMNPGLNLNLNHKVMNRGVSLQNSPRQWCCNGLARWRHART